MVIEGTTVKLVRGNTGVFKVSCVNDALTPEPIPFVTGDTVYFTVKKTIKDDVETFQKTITTFDDGKAVIKLMPADTKELLPGKYVYDIRVDFADGTVATIIESSEFVIKPAVNNE